MKKNKIHKAELDNGLPMERRRKAPSGAILRTGFYFVECGQRRINGAHASATWRGVSCGKCLSRRPQKRAK